MKISQTMSSHEDPFFSHPPPPNFASQKVFLSPYRKFCICLSVIDMLLIFLSCIWEREIPSIILRSKRGGGIVEGKMMENEKLFLRNEMWETPWNKPSFISIASQLFLTFFLIIALNCWLRMREKNCGVKTKLNLKQFFTTFCVFTFAECFKKGCKNNISFSFFVCHICQKIGGGE